MKRITTKLSLWLVGAVCAVAAFTAESQAATSAAIDIRVSISATKSLSVGTTVYNYGALNVNVSSVSSSILVTNDSGALTESYSLQGANAASTGGGTTWTLAASTSTDQYALAAQFSTSQPADTDAAFSSDDTTTSVINCTTTVFGNGTAGESGASVSPSAGSRDRNLWFRIRTPNIVSDTTQRLATLTLAVQ